LLEIAIEAAKIAGAIQRERFGTKLDVKLKGEVDLVTEVDLACEEAIRELFARLTPGVALLGEEGGQLSSEDGANERWIFDPLDGTTNYAHGVPHFCSSIAFEQGGKIVVGALYDPIKDELFTAKEGAGASLNGSPLHVSERSGLRQALLATGFPYDRATNPRKIFEAFTALTRAGRGIRRLGSAALDLAYVAAGRFDGFWEVGLKPWDLSAGALLVKEAGGKVSSFDKEFDHNLPDIIASNKHIHSELTEIILNYL
jgi:myo-inositol-1(or 4)-monophosphatase